MAKPLVLSLDGKEIAFSISKIDRTRLYGYVDVETLDDAGNRCELATLAGDGKTLIGSGGVAFASFTPDGQWCDKKELKPVDLQGQEVKPVESSFTKPVALEQTATVDEYLSHSIRGVYLLSCEGAMEPALLERLKKGEIFRFPFSYRGGLEADVAFLLAGADGAIWMALGKPADIRFIGFESAESAEEEETEADETSDEMDFSMM